MLRFIPPTIPHNVFIIGAGGTGGRLMPMLTQFLRSITRGVTAQGWIESPNVWVIDDDTVEQKNILRQNFISNDVGKPKAAVIAERYGRAYGVNCVPILRQVNPGNMDEIKRTVIETLRVTKNIDTTFEQIIDSSIVVICVDSVRARRDILNGFVFDMSNRDRNRNSQNRASRTLFIDSGNENTFGQVNFFTPTILTESDIYNARREESKVPKLVPVTVDVDYLPMDPEYYRSLVDTPAQGSCADLNQTLSINAIMATTIMGIIQNYFYRAPMTFNKLSISLDGGNYTTHNTFNFMKSLALTSDDLYGWSRGQMYADETDGTRTRMSFGRVASYITLQHVADLILAEIREQARLAEVERKKQEAKDAEEKSRLSKLAAIREKKRQRVEGAKVVEVLEATVETLSGLLRDPNTEVNAVAVDTETASLETLVSTPRTRARRNRVEEVDNAVDLAAYVQLVNGEQVAVAPEQQEAAQFMVNLIAEEATAESRSRVQNRIDDILSSLDGQDEFVEVEAA